jgi:hypothetical protein
MSDKKKLQLGMNPSTASHRLVKDILWKLIEATGQDACCKCKELMTRETFSIEHKVPWLDSKTPAELFFDLDNISFSHLRCNVEDRRITKKEYLCGSKGAYVYRGCRCSDCVKAITIVWAAERAAYDPAARREKYLRLGT